MTEKYKKYYLMGVQTGFSIAALAISIIAVIMKFMKGT